jgi:thiamine pyrophosphokinase
MAAMNKFVILLGGPISPTLRLLGQVQNARVLAADSGMAHARILHLVPELWVGDFDSAPKKLQREFANVPRLEFPVEKDATDGELAISHALREGADELILVGGFGGQFDHALAHAGFLLALAKRDIKAMMTSGTEEAQALNGAMTLGDLKAGSRLSVVPLSDLVALNISGVKWPLANRNVPLGSALTLSNVALGPVELSLRAGQALVVTYPVQE